ncbi:DMT family transporter [Salipiger sp. IMCC34102]|uniref:DMT family transporter n=1 Tax=Salipiger sp. IMCC34102 TaxID=2510647 RepID=UPI00101BB3FC|nr:DMT family transporter [Salipiger sp. IMCC34102]RYH02395.1 DMT family transporter [Salipiger sp. IMCC34102]
MDRRTAPSAPTATNWASIGLLGVIWGGTFMVVAVALRGYGPLTVSAARVTLGAAALLGLAVLLRRPFPVMTRRMAKYLVIIGVLNTALPFTLLSWGQQYVPSAFAGISMAALPLFVLPLAHVFSDEPLSLRRLLGVTLGFAGAVVLVGPGILAIGEGMEPLGQIACVAAAISYAVASIMTRRAPPIDSIVFAALTLVVGTAFLLPGMLIVEGVPRFTATLPGFAIIGLGLLPTALAALLRVMVIRSAGSVFMTLVNYQVPLWAMLLGAVLLDEDLPLRFFVALAMILAGLAVSQWNSLKRLLLR